MQSFFFFVYLDAMEMTGRGESHWGKQRKCDRGSFCDCHGTHEDVLFWKQGTLGIEKAWADVSKVEGHGIKSSNLLFTTSFSLLFPLLLLLFV